MVVLTADVFQLFIKKAYSGVCCSRDVVVQGSSKSRRIKTFTAVIFPEQYAHAQVNGPQNMDFSSASKLQYVVMVMLAVKGACTVT